MINYTIDGEKKEGIKDVKVKMIIDDDGDVQILVNDVFIAWFAKNGTFNRISTLSVREQERCGMQLDENNQLRVE